MLTVSVVHVKIEDQGRVTLAERPGEVQPQVTEVEIREMRNVCPSPRFGYRIHSFGGCLATQPRLPDLGALGVPAHRQRITGLGSQRADFSTVFPCTLRGIPLSQKEGWRAEVFVRLPALVA